MFPALPDFAKFVLAAVILILTPGPDTLYIVARSISQGKSAGVMSVLGISAGLLVQLALATLGISALIASIPALFTAIKFAGALYLIYIGIMSLRSKDTETLFKSLPRAELAQIFRQGLLTNILNPKVVLFFIAYLPQFIDFKRGHVPLQLATLGAVFTILGTIGNLGSALFAGSVGDWLRKNPKIAQMQRRLTGVVFILLGISLAFSSHH